MRAICKMDYGQFERNREYNYSYSYQNNFKKFHVKGQYADSEFTKRQFDTIFTTKLPNKNENKNYNCY